MMTYNTPAFVNKENYGGKSKKQKQQKVKKTAVKNNPNLKKVKGKSK